MFTHPLKQSVLGVLQWESHNKYSEAQTNGAFLSGKTPLKMLELVSHFAFFVCFFVKDIHKDMHT